jgi:hypothetical protein
MFIEAVVGFEWVAIIAVSSANVLRRVVEVYGISAVYSVHEIRICNWNASVAGHKQGTVDFPQRKQLPRSAANSSVNIST